jgi:hypothetical protein
MSVLFVLLFAKQGGELVGVFFYGLRICRAVDELPFPATINQAGILQDSQVVRHRGRGDSAERNDLSTGHVSAGTDGFKDAKSGLIGQGPGNAFDLLPIHLDQV